MEQPSSNSNGWTVKPDTCVRHVVFSEGSPYRGEVFGRCFFCDKSFVKNIHGVWEEIEKKYRYTLPLSRMTLPMIRSHPEKRTVVKHNGYPGDLSMWIVYYWFMHGRNPQVRHFNWQAFKTWEVAIAFADKVSRRM